ncbi:MAG: hypothetical protein J6K89_07995 [Oscillospiraceae bacterium]|nr:hypothetical protein [Oscillospiraceae bacterium]
MQNEKICGKISTKGGYLLCPKCNRHKVLRLLPGTEGKNISVYCKLCRKESIVNIDPKSLSLRA